MPRATEHKAKIEAERLEILHAQQRKLRKRLSREIKVKKAGAHLPGEEQLKKQMAVFLKIGVPGITFADIGTRVGEPTTTIRRWFRDDPAVKDFYDWAITNLKESALELMHTYGLEAVETLVLLMRFGSEKYMFESARDLLDRVGVAKVSRQEIDSEHTTKHKWSDHDALVKEIRELPIELQEEAIEVVDKLEELLARQANKDQEADNEETSELGSIVSDSEDDEDESDADNEDGDTD